MVIFFDLDDTLLDEQAAQEWYLEQLYAAWCQELPHEAHAFRAAWRAALARHFERQLRGEITQAEQRRARMRDVFGRPDMPDAEADARIAEFVPVYESSWRLFDDVLPTLDALARHPLGIITNGTEAQQRAKLERMGILDRFAVVVTSQAAGVAKPLPAIFHHAAARTGSPAGVCLHVGDDLHRDVAGALAAGMRPVWLDRGRTTSMRPVAGVAPEGVATIRSLLELPELLGAIEARVGPG